MHMAGLSESLSWLEMYIKDEAQDREADGNYLVGREKGWWGCGMICG